MNKILNTLFAVVLAVSTTQIQAQDETVVDDKLPHQKKNFTISTHPLYNFASGVRFDFEKRINQTPSWIQLGVAGYLMSSKSTEFNWTLISGDELSYLRGLGLEVNYKYFFNKKESLYVAGGGSYTHYNTAYMGDYWHRYTENGLEYIFNEDGKIKQRINKLGINTYFGYQVPTPTFLFDMFVGLGYRRSFLTNNAAKRFDDSMISLGHTGLVFITGVRFGVKF
jgi:hypothetical protein